MKKAISLVSVASIATITLAGCGTTAGTSSASGKTVLTVATVNNSQMVQMEQLTKTVFEKKYPNIQVKFVTLPENELRPKVTEDVATNSGEFDIVTIGNYETPIWAANGWIANLTPDLNAMSASAKKSYDYADLIKPIMQTLEYKNQTYALPFYGESSMIMYNKKIFAQDHLTMPL
ncbi:MAG: extracellular solute-binding protein, partial [Sulfobacillus thermotolerans]|nr:extracellular solute-binding protein [Sulfobacillus thermotolerans]